MLALTENAINAINELAPGDTGLRVSTTELPGPGTQPTFQVSVAPAPAPDDEVVEAGGARVFVEPRASALLDDKLLDAAIDGKSVRFAVANRN